MQVAADELSRLDAALAIVEDAGYVLTVRQLRLLLRLPPPGQPMPRIITIQDDLGFDKGVISRAVSALEAVRLVKRHPNPEHRGRQLIGLTTAGVSLRYRLVNVLAGHGAVLRQEAA